MQKATFVTTGKREDVLPQRWATREGGPGGGGGGAGGGAQGCGARGECIWTHGMLGIDVRVGLLT